MIRLSLIALPLVLSSSVIASDCNLTKEQSRLIAKASSYGSAFGYEKTLAAIVMQESFVGSYVVRVNPKDGSHGSYGITHILLDTAMWLEGIESSWKAKSYIVPKLIKDDLYALGLAVRKLDSIHQGDWIETWSAYNGGSYKYAISIRDNIRKLESCGYFSNWG